MIVLVVTLVVGMIAGFLAQRSRLCFVGGLRDFFLIGDTELLKGALAFFLAAWLMFPLASLLGGSVWQVAEIQSPAVASGRTAMESLPAAPHNQSPADSFEESNGPAVPFRPWLPATVAVLAGAGLGLVSILANGCPLRQHVLAAQGAKDGSYYLGGFYIGAVLYHTTLQPWLSQLLP